MSAETLRKAAALMRERAKAANGSPWSVETGLPGGNLSVRSAGTYRNRVYTRDATGNQPLRNAEHVASWHPAVALAVADWLDAEAKSLEFDTGLGMTYEEAMSGMGFPALAVATAYLGEAS